MKRPVTVAAVQPPCPEASVSTDDMIEQGLALLRQAAASGSELVCLPEYFNVFGLPVEKAQARAGEAAAFVERVRLLSEELGVAVVTPVLEQRGPRFFNAAWVFEGGRRLGCYDKVHLTQTERSTWRIEAGAAYPVFSLSVGRVGVSTCYDLHFPEAARILMLNGAEVVCAPSLQRGLTEWQVTVQMQARAWDNCLTFVRASYGTPSGAVWKTGKMVGKSCVVSCDGTVVADAGRYVGIALATVDLSPVIRETSHGAVPAGARATVLADRRPETYARLSRP